jgi:hypothetical protein
VDPSGVGRQVGRRLLPLAERVPGGSWSGDRPGQLQGEDMGPLDQSATFLTVTVPVDPRVPEFKEVKVHCFESSTMEAHQTCARRALKEVCVQLGEKLKDTPFSVLPTGSTTRVAGTRATERSTLR